MDFVDIAQAITDGLLFGATYSLIGIGFTMVFGVMDRINLAYAGSAIAGAYCSWALSTIVPMPAIMVFMFSMVASGVLGLLIYFCCFRFVPLQNPLATLLSTVGALIFIDEVIVHETDGKPQPYPALFSEVYFEIGEFYGIRGDLVFIFVLALIATVILLFLLYRTRLGLATRAVAQRPVAAQLCGISVEQTNATTFVITGVLGGLAGAMIGASVGVLSPLLSLPFTVKGLIVTVIGGLGSIPGAIVAGLMVGAFENFFQLVRGVTERDMYVMLLLFVFLTFRPGGIFSKSIKRD